MKLKIKDDVDLKELGFEKDDEDFIYADSYEFLIEEDRTIITSQFDTGFKCGEMRLERLFDLIKADMVEKVEG